MSKPATPAHRSLAEWSIRAGLVVAAAIIAYLSISRTVAYVLADKDLEQAHALAPHDGRITALLAEKLSANVSATVDRARADQLARDALRQDPTTVPAVAALGIDALIGGHVASARRLFAYSEMLSRRDLVTQLWEIQEAVGRSDVMAALKHYDIALRASPEIQDTLFPILASSISDPTIQSALIKTFAGRPLWAQDFINYVATKGHDPRATATFFRGLQRAGLPPSEAAQASLIGTLVSLKFFDDAWSYYTSVHRGADRRISRDQHFVANLNIPSWFDWMPVNDGSLSTSIQPGESGGIFSFNAPPSIGGRMLQQMQMLPPGNYILEGRSAGIDQPQDSLPYWVLSCVDGRELGRITVPSSSYANGVFAGRFAVPADCPAQSLSFMARSSEKVTGVSGEIDRLVLHPLH